MRHAHHFLAVATGLAIAIAGAFAVAEPTADAAGADAHFAQPTYEHARDGAVPDLTRYGVLGDTQKLAALGASIGVCHDALSAAGVRYREVPASHSGACGYDEALVVQASM